MKGRIRIERTPGIFSAADGKPIYIPAGAVFVASANSSVVASVKTLASATIEADAAHAIVEAVEADNFAHVVIGETEHVYRARWISSVPSPGKPETALDWKSADLQAVPVAAFSEG